MLGGAGYLCSVASNLEVRSSRARAFAPARVALPSWSGPAWGAIGVTALFIGITGWWLTQDHTIPIWDAGLHLGYVLDVHSSLSRGDLGTALTLTAPYPPFAYLVGSLGLAIGGIGVAPPIVAENLFFVSLLALGCYQVGRLAFGPLAGLLSVVFALGTPLIIAQFHIFMTDAPETAMVAVSIWLIIATEGFSRLRGSALAGLAVGVGMLTKEPFAIFVVGVVGVTAVRGGRQAWRGMAIFAVVALVIALPWYIHEYSKILQIKAEATASSSAIPGAGPESPSGIAPPRSSAANLEWYLWNIVGWQLYLPMFLFAAVGWLWTLLGSIRRHPITRLAPELLVGAFAAWLILTETYVHDVRYGMPLLIYLAVFGAGWIARLGRRGRIAASAALVVVALANTLAIDFGVGGEHGFWISKTSTALERPGYVPLYSTQGFPVGAPQPDGDLLGMLQALRRDGIRNDAWPQSEGLEPGFTNIGVSVLSTIAGLGQVAAGPSLTKRDAIFAYGKINSHESPPCVRLNGGFGVWVRIGNPERPGAQDYCPLPKPHFYGKRQP
jgi:hypothetical protein